MTKTILFALAAILPLAASAQSTRPPKPSTFDAGGALVFPVAGTQAWQPGSMWFNGSEFVLNGGGLSLGAPGNWRFLNYGTELDLTHDDSEQLAFYLVTPDLSSTYAGLRAETGYAQVVIGGSSVAMAQLASDEILAYLGMNTRDHRTGFRVESIDDEGLSPQRSWFRMYTPNQGLWVRVDDAISGARFGVRADDALAMTLAMDRTLVLPDLADEPPPAPAEGAIWREGASLKVQLGGMTRTVMLSP